MVDLRGCACTESGPHAARNLLLPNTEVPTRLRPSFTVRSGGFMQSPNGFAGWFLATLCLLTFEVGCGATIRSAAKDATAAAVPTAVDQSLKAVQDPGVRERIVQVLGTPEIQKAIQELAASVARGASEGLTDEQAVAKTTQIASALVAAATRVGMDAALAEATSPENEQRIEQLATSAADAATRAAIRAMAAELPTTFGPAVATMMREDVAPGLRGLVSGPEMRDAMSRVAFELSRQAVLGSNQALAELEERKQKKGLLERLTKMVATGGWVVWGLIGVLFSSILALVVALIRSREREKRFRSGSRASAVSREPSQATS
jgi:hypothetical protein